MEWKEKLMEIKLGLPKGEEAAKETGKGQEDLITKDASKEQDTLDERRKYEKAREAERQEKESDDTNSDFLALVRILDLKKSKGEYFRIRDLFYKARRWDVEFDVNRWLGSASVIGSELEAIKDRLKKQGYCSEAYNWWLSAQPEGMRYGKGTKEKRLEMAEEYAQKAGVPLEEIISNKSGN